MSAWVGDVSELGQLADTLEALARIPSRASKEAAKSISGLIDEQFTEGKDPYGKAWAPLAASTIARGRTEPPLTDTRHMRDTLHVRPLPGSGIAVTCDAEYLGFHQGDGTKDMPPRHVLPEGDIPDSWADAIGDALDQAFGEALG